MMMMKRNYFIYAFNAPISENIDEALKETFGEERALHIYKDLVSAVYKIKNNFEDYAIIISYKKSTKYPDLTWLDDNDPGFLESKTNAMPDRIYSTFKWAFNAGADKSVMLFNNVPVIETGWIRNAFDSIRPDTVALGPAGEKPYLIGLSHENLDLFMKLDFNSLDLVEHISDKIRRNGLRVRLLPESFQVNDEESLRRWLETKDDALSIFAHEEAKEHKKKSKKHNHGTSNQ